MFVINTRNEKFTNFDEESFKIYMKDVNQYPLLTTKEEEEIGYLAQTGDEQAIDLLIKSNLRFVISVAKSFALIVMVGKKSASGLTFGTPNFYFIFVVLYPPNNALSPLLLILPNPWLSTPLS